MNMNSHSTQPLEFTGEQEIIESDKTPPFVRAEHVERYRFACRFASKKRILDIASGSGYGARMLSKTGAESVMGIDISPECVKYARQFGTSKITFEVGDANNLDLLPGTFDLVVSFETIEHLADPRSFLASLSKALLPGGALIISTPNRRFSSPLYWLNRKPRNPYHLFELDHKEFLHLLSPWFSVEQMYGQRLLPNYMGWWPVLCGLKVVSLSLFRHDKLYPKLCSSGPACPVVA